MNSDKYNLQYLDRVLGFDRGESVARVDRPHERVRGLHFAHVRNGRHCRRSESTDMP
jgi:hypothetical protein